MRNDFEQAAYNPHEHNYTEWGKARLEQREKELNESLRNINHAPERLKQIQSELARIAFEKRYS